MASERFLKLDREKQARIYEASINEFADAGYSDASINKIIKEADISRGSFYTYFEDKKSVFGFVLEKIKDFAVDSVVDAVKKNNGDIFAACRYLIKKAGTLNPVEVELTGRFILKTFTDINSIFNIKHTTFANEMLDTIYANMDDTKELLTREEFEMVADALVTISVKALVMCKHDPEHMKKAIDTLYYQYDIIEKGIKGGQNNE